MDSEENRSGWYGMRQQEEEDTQAPIDNEPIIDVFSSGVPETPADLGHDISEEELAQMRTAGLTIRPMTANGSAFTSGIAQAQPQAQGASIPIQPQQRQQSTPEIRIPTPPRIDEINVQQTPPIQPEPVRVQVNNTEGTVPPEFNNVQGESYNPNSEPAPSGGLLGRLGGGGNNSSSANASNIVRDEPEFDDGSGGLFANKKVIIGIVAIIVVLGALCTLGVLGVISHQKKVADEEEAKRLAEIEKTESVFTYNNEELSSLRERGYTASEIEAFQMQKLDSKDLIEEADRKRQEYLDSTIKPVLDGASPAYKNMVDQTFMGQPQLDFGRNPEAYVEGSFNYNADYWKIPARGMQLYLKLRFGPSKEYTAWMTVSPQRYIELPDSGNINVSITVTDCKPGLVITDIQEIEL